MADVAVIGGGLGGIAASLRLAKLGHRVTLLEAGPTLGGALRPVEREGYVWDGGPATTTLPAVVRDLFRKTGRPLEDELARARADYPDSVGQVPTDQGLRPLPMLREHRFADRSVLRLPTGRSDQTAAFDELGKGLGRRWESYVDSYADEWDVLRRHRFEQATPHDELPSEAARLLQSRDTLHQRLRRAFRDDRPLMAAAHPVVAQGHDLRNVPAWAGLPVYWEQSFGIWELPGGMRTLLDLLQARLVERGVTVIVSTPVVDIVVRESRVVAVRTEMGEVAADVVVCAVDPRTLPTLAPHVEQTMPALPPVVAHVGLTGDVPPIDCETVVHGNPEVTIRPAPQRPEISAEGGVGWTLHGRGTLSEDMLNVLARAKIDVRHQVVTRVDLSPLDLVREWHGSPCGLLWQGRRTLRRQLGPRTPITGVYAAGAHAAPGAGIASVGMSAALVAEAVGAA
ncbi:NAD(P)/FAD-dependent oxidoreductase [Nocardioides sp. R-C-SC26]|uniref:phytoene desaturase family protein n=1 Tax=Nocardioides sp. R-C-SC26 TaxID=2870414 RepID=UPI001E36D78C|nr:FAD-dependent oxidoreductase [Nocardioides sp. R-C-SC26]